MIKGLMAVLRNMGEFIIMASLSGDLLGVWEGNLGTAGTSASPETDFFLRRKNPDDFLCMAV